jgi:integrase
MDFVHLGIRVNKSTKCTNQREAKEAIKKTKEEIEERILSTPKQKSMSFLFSQAIERAYEDHFCHQETGKTTLARLKTIQKIVGDKPIGLLDSQDVILIKSKLAAMGRSLATTHRYLAHLRTLLHLARDEWEVLSKAPKISIPREKRSGRKFIYSEELEERIIDYFRTFKTPYTNSPFAAQMADLFPVLIDTGLRLSEALQSTKTMIKDSLWILDPKEIRLKDGEYREVPITDRSMSILKRRIKVYPSKLFPFDKSTCARAMKRMREDLGIKDKDACLHACRHTCATRLLQAGVDSETVRIWLGHSSLATTEQYLHSDRGKLLEAVMVLEKPYKHLRIVSM